MTKAIADRLWKNMLTVLVVATAVFIVHATHPAPTPPHAHDHVIAQQWSR